MGPPMRSNQRSVFQAIAMREVCPYKVMGRPNLGEFSSEGGCTGSGVLTVEPNGISAPPLANAYGKKKGDGHLLAVADEEGFVSIFNTCRQLPTAIDSEFETGKCRLALWMAHMNAIFDVCWMRDDTRILTASGDQMIRLWDVEAHKEVGVMKGHSGSVKSLCTHPSDSDLFVSGSRDGSVAFWDLRASTTNGCSRPVASIDNIHMAPRSKHVRRSKGGTHSVTAVLYQRDELVLATTGSVDGVVKFWDTRKLKGPVAQTPPLQVNGIKGGRMHGITSLSRDPAGTRLIASCTDNRIYLYDGTHPEKGAMSSFAGHVVDSFYIKAAFSPDGDHILSGSTDGNVFVWQVDKPNESPVILKGHTSEVTAVDWSLSSFHGIATCSDDCTVRVWSIKKLRFTNLETSPHVLRSIPPQPCSSSPQTSPKKGHTSVVHRTGNLQPEVDNDQYGTKISALEALVENKENACPCFSKEAAVGVQGSHALTEDVNALFLSQNFPNLCEKSKSGTLQAMWAKSESLLPKRRRTILHYFSAPNS